MVTKNMRTLLTALFGCLLMACTPALNWRELPAADGHLRALFPAKPVTVTRQWRLEETTRPMTLTAARIDGAQFAAGYVPVNGTQGQSIARAWAQAMLANIQAKPEAKKHFMPIVVPGAVGAFEMVASGTVENVPGRIHAQFAWQADAVLATIAVGPSNVLKTEDAETFAKSMKLQ